MYNMVPITREEITCQNYVTGIQSGWDGQDLVSNSGFVLKIDWGVKSEPFWLLVHRERRSTVQGLEEQFSLALSLLTEAGVQSSPNFLVEIGLLAVSS